MQHWWYDIWKRINDSKIDPNNTRMMLSFPTNSSCPIINNISNKMLNEIKNFLKFYNAIFWSKRSTIVFFHAWKSGWCLINHYEIQNFEIPIRKILTLNPPGKEKSLSSIYLICSSKGSKTLIMFWREWRAWQKWQTCEHYKQMK